MLSYIKGRPIAKVIDDSGEHRLLRLDTDPKQENSSEDNTADNAAYSLRANPLECPHCHMKFARSDITKRHIDTSCKGKLFKQMFRDLIQDEKRKTERPGEDLGKELRFEEGEVQVLPNKNKREILYIAGPQGSGKSHYTGKYIKEFKKMFPNKAILLFSKIDDDVSFRDIKGIKQINIDDDLIDDPIDVKKELKNSLCIFDDIDSIRDKDLQHEVYKLRDEIQKVGRDQAEEGNDIYMCITNHQMTDYKNTRDCLNECTSITLFPKSGSSYGITRVLQHYCGFSKKDVDKVLKLPSRWVSVYKNYPQYVIHEKGCYLVK